MFSPRFALAILLCGLPSGCTTLKDSIQQRISVSEQCRIATAAVPDRWGVAAPLASIHLGNLGTCSVSGYETLLPMCSLEQIGGKYGLLPAAKDPGATQQAVEALLNPELDKFRSALDKLRDELKTLSLLLTGLDKQYRQALSGLKNKQYDARTAARAKLQQDMQAITLQLASVRYAQELLRERMEKLSVKLKGQASIELAAWDANLRIHLAQFEQLLAGDLEIIFRSGVRDQVMTHVARRSLDMLHSALKPADVVLNKLDEKAYGAVSIGYLAFGPNIQRSVNSAFGDLKEAYGKRFDKTLTEEELLPFLREVRRAACDNLVQGDRFTMLTELVDTMLIMQINKHDPILAKKTDEAKSLEGARTVSFVMITDPATAGSVASASLPDSSADNDRVTGPLNVYKANEWAARQQLLVQKIAAKMENAPAAAEGKRPFPDIAAVDEAAVTELAEAATAIVVDDAARVQPSMLHGGSANAMLQNQITVSTASVAVSHASVNLKLNLSVSNINTFNPSNHNAPVFNLPPQPAPVPADKPLSLCDALTIAAHGAECSDEPGGPVITFKARTFHSDSCNPADLEPTLSAVGRTLAAYRARYGAQMDAVVHGFASLRPAKLAKCPVAQKAPARNCLYSNRLHATFDIEYCPEAKDHNVTLSAARASRAAAVLERTAQGAVTVTSVVAHGAETAQPGMRPAAAEQTVIIQLVARR